MFVGSLFDRHTGIGWSALAVPLAWPLVYLVFLLTVGIVAALLAGMFDNIVGTVAAFMAFIMSLYQTAGDPLVYLLQRARPALVPIDRYPFLGFTLILWVLKPS
jgi:MFS superfamily sulfate permease-like transporter